jgi:hypothetical protein
VLVKWIRAVVARIIGSYFLAHNIKIFIKQKFFNKAEPPNAGDWAVVEFCF